MGPPSSKITEFQEYKILVHANPIYIILNFSFWPKTAHLAIIAIFEVTKPMVEIASRDHIVFFQGLRPMAFGPKFISNYSKAKNRDRRTYTTHDIMTGNAPRRYAPRMRVFKYQCAGQL